MKNIFPVYIVSNYSSGWESINTERGCLLFLKLKYAVKGYRVFQSLKFIYKITKKQLKGNDVFFERYVKGSKQVTFYEPYMNSY